MTDEKTLSETIISMNEALEKWNSMKPVVDEVDSIVKEYGELIDSVGKVFTVVGFVWDIYSNMEKAKEDAARLQNMI
ncbi:hypothetical protein VI817_009053 [Penicillium citrinum]|nr:hypothetical protein VI817_009053 [Penicillium citrinum]